MYSKLTSIEIPESVTQISGFAFYGSSLNNIAFPKHLTIIDYNAFSACKGLTKIEIPEGVKTIGSSCFESCSNLIDVQIPSSIETLGGGAFKNCHPNITIHFNKDSDYFLNEQFMITNKANTSIIMYMGEAEELTIPTSIQTIQEKAFKSSKTITKIEFEK